MLIKRDYLQYVNSIREAELEMISNLKKVIDQISDPEILKPLESILKQEKGHLAISDSLLSIAAKLS